MRPPLLSAPPSTLALPLANEPRSDRGRWLVPLAWVWVVSACSAPPLLPQADETTRRPANSPQALAQQRCEFDRGTLAQRLATQERVLSDTQAQLRLMAARETALQARLQEALSHASPSTPPTPSAEATLPSRF